ncbi:coiled-coil domain-containing protein 15 [Porphyrio hochstetteri]
MLPPAEAGERPGGRRARPPLRGWRVLAERNQSVAPVGAWVESASGRPEESAAFASAFQVEEELKEQQQRKAASLRRFQGEVRQRVNQQVRMRRKQQLQKSCEAAERESRLATQYSRAALCLTPRRNTCLYRSQPQPVIGGPQARAAPLQQGEVPSQPFQQQAAKLSQTMKQARHRLASCRTLPQGTGSPQLPGGVWSPEEPEPCVTATTLAADASEELLLAGHHDLPAELQGQGLAPPQPEGGDDFYIKIEFQKQQSEYLRHRRLFLSVERQRVREQQRQRERQKRMAEIKSKQETQRWVEEQRMQEMSEQREPSSGEAACGALAQAQLEERRVREVKASQQRRKEYMRYVEALRAQMREKIKLSNIDLPPLCSCGSDFWDSHPDTCANNCVFYKNHKAYSQALLSLLSSCTPPAALPLRGLAMLCPGPGKRL